MPDSLRLRDSKSYAEDMGGGNVGPGPKQEVEGGKGRARRRLSVSGGGVVRLKGEERPRALNPESFIL